MSEISDLRFDISDVGSEIWDLISMHMERCGGQPQLTHFDSPTRARTPHKISIVLRALSSRAESSVAPRRLHDPHVLQAVPRGDREG